MLGALNAITKELVCVINDTVVNAETVRELLDKITAVQSIVPVTMILDNARYQRCGYVTEYAGKLGIELLFLPPYSPHLNLIERLWKFIKKTCLYSLYYPDFKTFSNAIRKCVDDLPHGHHAKLQSLLTLNFQSYSNLKISA